MPVYHCSYQPANVIPECCNSPTETLRRPWQSLSKRLLSTAILIEKWTLRGFRQKRARKRQENILTATLGVVMLSDKNDSVRLVDQRVWSETGCTCFLVTSTKHALF